MGLSYEFGEQSEFHVPLETMQTQESERNLFNVDAEKCAFKFRIRLPLSVSLYATAAVVERRETEVQMYVRR